MCVKCFACKYIYFFSKIFLLVTIEYLYWSHVLQWSIIVYTYTCTQGKFWYIYLLTVKNGWFPVYAVTWCMLYLFVFFVDCTCSLVLLPESLAEMYLHFSWWSHVVIWITHLIFGKCCMYGSFLNYILYTQKNIKGHISRNTHVTLLPKCKQCSLILWWLLRA